MSTIQGKWECFTTQLVAEPYNGCEKALVIVGSDKRGAIFGTYTFSADWGFSVSKLLESRSVECIVRPAYICITRFHFWSDVPVDNTANLYALDVATRDGPPTVKYRRIFINDESPCLTGWVEENFGPKYNSEFYKKVIRASAAIEGRI